MGNTVFQIIKSPKNHNMNINESKIKLNACHLINIMQELKDILKSLCTIVKICSSIDIDNLLPGLLM